MTAAGAGPGGHEEALAATDAWFARNGLSYFVPEVRADARAALRWRRAVPVLVAAALLAALVAAGLAWATGRASLAPAVAWTVAGLVLGWYAATALRAGSIVSWALVRTFGSLRTLLPMMSRALPLLLIFVTFLFINAEVWQVAAGLDGGLLWLVVLVFATLSIGFLLVRLPEEVDRTDDDVDESRVRQACQGTPLQSAADELADDPAADPSVHAEVVGYERWNLVLVLLVIQATQVLLLALGVLAFFLLFGALVMEPDTVKTWTGEPRLHTLPFLPESISAELFQVSVFLASFSSLYLTVSTVTDDAYRAQFFGSVLHEMERAVGVRAAYLALRARGPASGT